MERKKKYYFRCQGNMTPTLSSLMMVAQTYDQDLMREANQIICDPPSEKGA